VKVVCKVIDVHLSLRYAATKKITFCEVLNNYQLRRELSRLS